MMKSVSVVLRTLGFGTTDPVPAGRSESNRKIARSPAGGRLCDHRKNWMNWIRMWW